LENSISDIKKFLQEGSEPLENAEFMEFWNSLTDEEKEEYKNTPLPKSE
jgi:hypothetical protein